MVKSAIAVPITIISAYCSVNFPINRFIGFIPEDKGFSVSITVYSGLLTLLISFLIGKLEVFIDSFKTIVKITYSESKEFIESNEVRCSFNMDTCKLFIRIRMTGVTKKMSDYEINIEAPKDVLIKQCDEYLDYGKLSQDEMNFTLPMSNILNMRKDYLDEEEFIIPIYLIKKREFINSYLETKLIKKNKKIDIICNKVKLTC